MPVAAWMAIAIATIVAIALIGAVWPF